MNESKRTAITSRVKGALTLTSIQSVPVSVATILLGYASVTGTIMDETVIPLVVAAGIGHLGFYSMNDVLDYDWDVEQERDKKPLVAGLISRKMGLLMSGFLIMLSVAYAAGTFPRLSYLLFVAAAIFGGAYNWKSKSSPYSAILLGA